MPIDVGAHGIRENSLKDPQLFLGHRLDLMQRRGYVPVTTYPLGL
jgi:hypothetical protein